MPRWVDKLTGGRFADAAKWLYANPFLNSATSARIAQADIVRMTNDFLFEPAVEPNSRMLVTKTICAAMTFRKE